MSRRKRPGRRPQINQKGTAERSKKVECGTNPQPTPEIQEVNKVRRGILGAIGGAVVISGIYGLKELFSEDNTQTKGNEAEGIELISPSTIKLADDKEIDIPAYSVKTVADIPYEKPDTLKMDDAEFSELSKRFAWEIRQLAEDFNKKVGDDKRLYLANLNDIMQKVQNVVMYGDPRITADFKEFSKSIHALKKEDQFPLIIERINQFLLPAGMYIFFQLKTRNNIPRLNIYSVTESGEVTFSDKVRNDKVPFLKLDAPLLPAHRFQLGGTIDPTKKRVVIFQDELAFIEKDFLAAAGLPLNENNKREFGQNSLRHEATHLFLNNRFPKLSDDIEKAFPHEIDYELDGEKKKHTMNIHIYSAHEVCGLAAQLMNAKTKMELLAYLNIKGQEQYALAQALIIIAVLQIADSSLGNCDISDTLNGNCESGLANALEIVRSPDFSAQDSQRVGQILYKFGYSFFKNHEKNTSIPNAE